MCAGNPTQDDPQAHHKGPSTWVRPDASPHLVCDDVSEHAYWVETIKAAQKGCAQMRAQWRDYCDVFGGGTRDPRLHSASFLQHFFLLRVQGAIPALPIRKHEKALPEQGREDTEAHGILVAKVKRVQRYAEDRQAWPSHCDRVGFGRNTWDHPCSSLRNFMIQVGASVGAQRDPYSVPAAYAPSELSTCVKKMQSMKFKWKQQWDAYCDTCGGGVRDPQRHPEAFLQGFICIAQPKPNPAIILGKGDAYTPTAPHEYPQRFARHERTATGVADYVLLQELTDNDPREPTQLPFGASFPASEPFPAVAFMQTDGVPSQFSAVLLKPPGLGACHNSDAARDSGNDTGSGAVVMAMSF